MSNHTNYGPRRFYPASGRKLTVANVRGPWRASGCVGPLGVFSVIWTTKLGDWWAPLHDFDLASQQRLIEACRWQDLYAGFPGAWPEGRHA